MITLKDLKNMWHYRRELKLAVRTHLSFLAGDGALEALGGLTDKELRALFRGCLRRGYLLSLGRSSV